MLPQKMRPEDYNMKSPHPVIRVMIEHAPACWSDFTGTV